MGFIERLFNNEAKKKAPVSTDLIRYCRRNRFFVVFSGNTATTAKYADGIRDWQIIDARWTERSLIVSFSNTEFFYAFEYFVKYADVLKGMDARLGFIDQYGNILKTIIFEELSIQDVSTDPLSIKDDSQCLTEVRFKYKNMYFSNNATADEKDDTESEEKSDSQED